MKINSVSFKNDKSPHNSDYPQIKKIIIKLLHWGENRTFSLHCSESILSLLSLRPLNVNETATRDERAYDDWNDEVTRNIDFENDSTKTASLNWLNCLHLK